MASNKDLNGNENILIKVDENNLIFIDPNSVYSEENGVEPRGVKQEELVTYINLEADIIPRTTLLSTENQGNTLHSVARGRFNLLSGDKIKKQLDTTWTDTYNPIPNNNKGSDENTSQFTKDQFSSSSPQSFGIKSINVDISASHIPSVTINFTDVRGKTLFENPPNSPYKSFFHLPWPIFYLSIKGYYGKAIRYRLHMHDFTSSFDDSSGNFDVTAVFVGSTHAFLNDITLSQVSNAPYMFLTEIMEDGENNTSKDNTVKKMSKRSRGYAILESVYNQYKQKELIPKDFPVLTLKEMGTIADSLDKILEKQIFKEVVDMKVFQSVKEIEDQIETFKNDIGLWSDQRLSSREFKQIPIGTETENYYYLSSKDGKTSLEYILGDGNDTLERKIKINTELLFKSSKVANDLMNKTTADFGKIAISKVKKVEHYYKIDDDEKVMVGIDILLRDIDDLTRSFREQKEKLQDDVEKKMNTIVSNKKTGLGFEPTIRNIFAVILANADVYVKLMKEVHEKAFNQADERKKKIGNLTNEQKTKDGIFPWPEIKLPSSGGQPNVITYPGSSKLIDTLRSDIPSLWPEVEFVEEYIAIAGNKHETNINQNSSSNESYIFESDVDESKFRKVSTIDVISDERPYVNKTMSGFAYELYERAKYITLLDSFNHDYLNKLAIDEAENIKQAIQGDSDLINLVKKIDSVEDLLSTSVNTATDPNNNDGTIFSGLLPGLSPFERFTYLRDNLPTVPYLQTSLNFPFLIESAAESKKYKEQHLEYKDNYNNYLKNYIPEDYRTNIYPFNSSTYLSYLKKDAFTVEDLKFEGNGKTGLFSIDTVEGYINISPESSNYSSFWVKDGYEKNLFTNKLTIEDTEFNVLNTPYFHNQLLADFFKSEKRTKFTGSSYLLLNSLPFKDLDEKITIDGKTILMSSLFKEISSSHYVPYHLMVKWGSIYHRYKKFILDGTDILENSIDGSNLTKPIDGDLFFDNNSGFTYNIDGDTVKYSDKTDVGIHPFYDSIYHQIINGYAHHDPKNVTSYSNNTTSGGIVHRKRTPPNKTSRWSIYTDNRVYNPLDESFTLLPCDGGSKNSNWITETTYSLSEQAALKTLWFEEEIINNELSGQTFSQYDEYVMSSGGTFSIETNQKKVIDLIATFSPKILDEFESEFLLFSEQQTNEEIPYLKYDYVEYINFESILKKLSKHSISEGETALTKEGLINKLTTAQEKRAELITTSMLSSNNLMKLTFANPKEIDPYTFYGVSNHQNYSNYSVNDYSPTDATQTNLDLIKLYIGEDIDTHYLNFFYVNNVKLTEENILTYRPIAQIYGGYVESGKEQTKLKFSEYIRDEFFNNNPGTQGHPKGAELRLQTFLASLLREISKDKGITPVTSTSVRRTLIGYADNEFKLALYNTFKLFNDRWSAGNSIGQRLLLEEFLFLDKANTDIGDRFYINISKVKDLLDPRNSKVSLYTGIAGLIAGSGLDMRPLPAYVNFYGTNFNHRGKPPASKNVARDLFGTFLEVDYQDATPKIIIQYGGSASSRLADIEDNKFSDDGFNMETLPNPLIVTSAKNFSNYDADKSNRVVAFEVSFGDQNQGIFQGVELSQASLRNTSETFKIIENINRSQSGAGVYNVDTTLFDYYKRAAFTCKVKCLGNVMIQPTMYFQLKNVPMFRGAYLILEVNHQMEGNQITTTFTGIRISKNALPDPEDSFIASYRTLFDRISERAIQQVKQLDTASTTTEVVVKTKDGTESTDPGEKSITGEKSINGSGISEYGIPYNGKNGDKTIQKIKYNGEDWFRTRVVKLGGENNTTLSPTTHFPIPDMDYANLPPHALAYTLHFDEDTFKTANLETYRTLHTQFTKPPTKEGDKTYQVKLSYEKGNKDKETKIYDIYSGPLGRGPESETYGMAMTYGLMKFLNLTDGDVVYFKLET